MSPLSTRPARVLVVAAEALVRLVGDSAPMRLLTSRIAKVARSTAPAEAEFFSALRGSYAFALQERSVRQIEDNASEGRDA